MKCLIKSFEDSLWNDYLSGVGQELLENAIDNVLENEAIKKIPIVGTLMGVSKFIKNLHDRNLLRNTLIFIKKINGGQLTEEEKTKYLTSIKNPNKFESEMGRVLMLLNRNIDINKNLIYANLFIAYIKELVNWNEFCEMSDVTERLFITDVTFLFEAYKTEGINDISKIDYRVDRLNSLGLMENQNRISGGMYITYPDETSMENLKLVTFTSLGKKFADIIFLDY